MYRGSENAVVETVLRRRPGVVDVEGNAAAQTASVTFDPSATSIAELRQWVEDCGYHCAGRSVPDHICDPLMEEGASPAPADEAHAHGGHAGMSMDDMERDMRNRFLVALVFTIPTVIWSPVGETLFGSMPDVPFGLDIR
jgi:Cu2+-exporting ATPase